MNDLSADKSDEDEDTAESYTYNLDDIEDDDDDIDIDYDWNAKSLKNVEKAPATNHKTDHTKDDDKDDDNDDDIDVDYDWNANKSFKHFTIDVDSPKIEFEGSFNLDSPKLLDTPLYSETPNLSMDFTYRDSIFLQNIVDLNVTVNSYDHKGDSMDMSHLSMEISHLSADSPVSELTQDGSLMPFNALALRPSHSARTMNVISETTKECEEDHKDDDASTDYIERIDSLLG
eukprot:59220_1